MITDITSESLLLFYSAAVNRAMPSCHLDSADIPSLTAPFDVTRDAEWTIGAAHVSPLCLT